MPTLNGEISLTLIANPHFVQLNVPERGFGDELDAMVQFCLEHGEEFRIGCFRESKGETVFFSASEIRGMRRNSRGALEVRSF